MTKRSKFPFPHIVLNEKKEVWILYSGSSIAAAGLPSLVQSHYPGYSAHIASESFFHQLNQS